MKDLRKDFRVLQAAVEARPGAKRRLRFLRFRLRVELALWRLSHPSSSSAC